MKKFLLILSLASGFASISAAKPTAGAAAAAAGSASGSFYDYSNAFKDGGRKARNAVINGVVNGFEVTGICPRNNKRLSISAVVVLAGVTFAGKKAYDRYKAWKKAKADKADVTA